MQRKLTEEQKRHAGEALANLVNICQWDLLPEGYDYWAGVCSKLASMIEHSTTDGKPYVEPEPPIPDGFRKAVVGDEARPDCEWWNGKEWVRRWPIRAIAIASSFDSDFIYIVPVDRVPTDDEAKERPVVMVRDSLGEEWRKRRLVAVVEGTALRFVSTSEVQTGYAGWKYCRHLYDGE